MHRRGLKTLLAEYRERWPQEGATVARFNAFVDSHPDCFHRSCRIGHITGSAWLVDMAGDRVLLAHHRTLGRWLQPGGHSDRDPDGVHHWNLAEIPDTFVLLSSVRAKFRCYATAHRST